MLRALQQQGALRAFSYESDIGTFLRYLETSFNRLAIQVELVMFGILLSCEDLLISVQLIGDVIPELSLTLLGNMGIKLLNRHQQKDPSISYPMLGTV